MENKSGYVSGNIVNAAQRYFDGQSELSEVISQLKMAVGNFLTVDEKADSFCSANSEKISKAHADFINEELLGHPDIDADAKDQLLALKEELSKTALGRKFKHF